MSNQKCKNCGCTLLDINGECVKCFLDEGKQSRYDIAMKCYEEWESIYWKAPLKAPQFRKWLEEKNR